jgi:hypothetical protein
LDALAVSSGARVMIQHVIDDFAALPPFPAFLE